MEKTDGTDDTISMTPLKLVVALDVKRKLKTVESRKLWWILTENVLAEIAWNG